MSSIFLQGNARDKLKGLPPDFFHCAATSPPYFGLRRYDGGEEVWGGDDGCEHEWADEESVRRDRGVAKGITAKVGNQVREVSGTCTCQGRLCAKCGAWRGQLGGEPTPELYITHLVEICREVRRVLRPDGVFWLNIGDSWGGSGKGQMGDGSHASKHGEKQHTNVGSVQGGLQQGVVGNGIKPLDMVLIPSQLALALRTDGWYVRSVIVWSKNNPMPESVNGWRWERHKVKVARSQHELDLQQHVASDGIGRTTAGLNVRKERCAVDGWQDCPGCAKCSPNDGYVLRKGSWRPTDSYEVILMLAKTNSYYCDKDAVIEPIAASTVGRGKVSFGGAKGREYNPDIDDPNYRGGTEQWGREYDYTQSNPAGGRNLRSVWEFPTKPYSGAHFAVFPPRLPELCIKSSTSEKGCCPVCGKPWARVIDKGMTDHDSNTECGYVVGSNAHRPSLLRQAAREHGGEYHNGDSTVGWRPTCACGSHEVVPCRVLDPFSGAGTTALVGEQLGRDTVNIDTSAKYIELSKTRIADDEQKRISAFIRRARNGNRNGRVK